MMARQTFGWMALAAGLALIGTAPALAQGRKSDAVVKARVTSDKPGNDGKQTVTINLEIDPKYHIYANPVGQADFADNQTTVTVTGKNRPESVKVEYPRGEKVEDKVVGDYEVYRGKATIRAVVQRARGDSEPLEVSIKIQACSKTSCLLPATIKVSVP